MRSLWLPFLLVVALATLLFVGVYRAHSQRTQALVARNEAAPVTPTTASKPIVQSYGEKVVDFVVPAAVSRHSGESEGPPPLPKSDLIQFISPPTTTALFPPRARPAPLAQKIPPTYYLPSHRLIRCRLVSGVQTGRINSPIIGFVLVSEDNIGPDGISREVIPAGVEVHGKAVASPMRDRIDGNGAWTFVWRTNDENNGMELPISATALTRDYDDTTHLWGDQEKSPGLIGTRFEGESNEVIKLALLKALGAVPAGFEQYTTQLNQLTNQAVSIAKPGLGNTMLQSASAGMDSIAASVESIRKQIEENGYYVAVLPGREFYLYTESPIDLRLAHRPESLTGEQLAKQTAPTPGNEDLAGTLSKLTKRIDSLSPSTAAPSTNANP